MRLFLAVIVTAFCLTGAASAQGVNDTSALERNMATEPHAELRSVAARTEFCTMQAAAITGTPPKSPARIKALRAIDRKFPGAIGRATNCDPYGPGSRLTISSPGAVTAQKDGDLFVADPTGSHTTVVGHYRKGDTLCVVDSQDPLMLTGGGKFGVLEVSVNSQGEYVDGTPGRFQPAADPGDCAYIANYRVMPPGVLGLGVTPQQAISWGIIYGVIGVALLIVGYGLFTMVRRRRS